jgi:hypothetical protein
MSRIKRINEEMAAPRIPVSEKYWISKGKRGKIVSLYTHDDLDGIMTAIEMKKYLLNKGFTIEKYGILNYSEGWKYTTLDPTSINIVLDFANMPGDERDELIDYYLDHHGLFSEEDLEKYKNSPVQKKKTGSAYEAICQALGVPQDEMVLSVIDMIDSAKYQDYGVSWQRLLDFNLEEIKKSDKKRLEFAAAFNQFLKRSDTQTLIEVIENTKDASIYAIYNTMKLLYPENNPVMGGPRKGQKKDFIEDSLWRQGEMQKRTRGRASKKKVYKTFNDFLVDWYSGSAIKNLDGYQAIGDLVFIPSGTWANALRARTIIEKDIMDGVFEDTNYEPKFILLQYGGTLQVCSYKKMNETENLPKLKSGEEVNDLGKYMSSLLKNFQEHLDYYDPDTSIGQDEITVSGGHGGIGSISNIFGRYKGDGPLEGVKYVDIFKNKIISDLSGVKLGLSLVWSDSEEQRVKPLQMDNKVRDIKDVKRVSPTGRILRFGEI